MPISPEHETELLEALSESQNANECLLSAYDVLDDTVDAVLKSIFHKDDYAVKFVVEPLLTTDGPLGDVLIRCKLLLGFGGISKQTYDDIEVFVTLKEWARHEPNVSFVDPNVLFELNRVQAIHSVMPLEFSDALIEGLDESSKQMFLQRHFLKVRSTIVLAVTSLMHSLCKENALTS
ncbi:mannitol operon repressor [Vibrio sp. qd031]|uniref:MltR family transcriptional regulator n=1 Tax=Vibrio sp. qd031 TaxID=1603038 RepID=UPI000A0F564C|nr:MltR family transcriptional regulator [Vibrio sp. qd031]ORT48238.1 mannitol operon repressor [Vibrio sp. qd031]